MVDRLRGEFGLGVPYHDEGVALFGLRNAVFAVGDTFLEVVSPVRDDAPAARQLARSGRDVCGYMAMLQVDDVDAARVRARVAGVREVFDVALDDITEVHLHPSDVGGAIVSLSEPQPAATWRWGGDDWPQRTVPGAVSGITVEVAEPDAVAGRWTQIAGGEIPGCTFVTGDRGIVEIALELNGASRTLAV